jgi:hypothetical protein
MAMTLGGSNPAVTFPDGTIQNTATIIPVGTIIDFAGAAANVPTGFLVCPTGVTNISRTTYAALFAVCGTLWGAGDGSTTFGMPYFPAYFASLQASSDVGSVGAGTIQAHTHGIFAPNAASSVGGTVLGHTQVTQAAGSITGNNFAAGMRVLKCVKF